MPDGAPGGAHAAFMYSHAKRTHGPDAVALQKRFDDAAEMIVDSIRNNNKYPAGWTKYEVPPTINVQHCALKSTSKKAQDEAIAAAIKALQSLVDEGNAASVLQLLSNQGVGALKEMLNDIIRPHIFNNETLSLNK